MKDAMQALENMLKSIEERYGSDWIETYGICRKRDVSHIDGASSLEIIHQMIRITRREVIAGHAVLEGK